MSMRSGRGFAVCGLVRPDLVEARMEGKAVHHPGYRSPRQEDRSRSCEDRNRGARGIRWLSFGSPITAIPDESIFDVIDDLSSTLDGEDRLVTREVLIEARMDGQETIGEVLQNLENMAKEERRDLVDRARGRIGLPSVGSVQWEQARLKRTAKAPPQRDEAGLAFQTCAAPDCLAEPISEVTGAPKKVAAKRW